MGAGGVRLAEEMDADERSARTANGSASSVCPPLERRVAAALRLLLISMMEFVLAHRDLAAFDAPACVSAFVTSRTVTVVAAPLCP